MDQGGRYGVLTDVHPRVKRKGARQPIGQAAWPWDSEWLEGLGSVGMLLIGLLVGWVALRTYCGGGEDSVIPSVDHSDHEEELSDQEDTKTDRGREDKGGREGHAVAAHSGADSGRGRGGATGGSITSRLERLAQQQ